jgi:hypothetical protein
LFDPRYGDLRLIQIPGDVGNDRRHESEADATGKSGARRGSAYVHICAAHRVFASASLPEITHASIINFILSSGFIARPAPSVDAALFQTSSP